MLKCLFNKVAVLRPVALLKRDSRTGAFPWILRDTLEHLFCRWLSHVIQNRCSKESRKIRGKTHVNGCFWYSWEWPCLAGCKFLNFLQNWLSVSIEGIESFHWDAVFNWSCTDEYPTNVLKLITQHWKKKGKKERGKSARGNTGN